MELLFVGIGGIFGGGLRFVIGETITEKANTKFPVATFLINITGAFLLGILTSFNPGGNIYLLLGDGFLGSFTTFSTFMYEGFNLFKTNKKKNAVVYILGSVFFGLIAYILGFAFINYLK